MNSSRPRPATHRSSRHRRPFQTLLQPSQSLAISRSWAGLRRRNSSAGLAAAEQNVTTIDRTKNEYRRHGVCALLKRWVKTAFTHPIGHFFKKRRTQ